MIPEELKRKGHRLVKSGDFSAAEEAFRKLIEIDSNSILGHRGLAVALSRQGRYAEVVEHLRPHLARLDSPSLWIQLASASRTLIFRGDKHRVDEALEAFEYFHKTVREPASLFERAQLLQKFKRDYQAALQLYLEAWRREPRNQQSYTAALVCLRRLDRNAEVEALKTEWAERSKADR